MSYCLHQFTNIFEEYFVNQWLAFVLPIIFWLYLPGYVKTRIINRNCIIFAGNKYLNPLIGWLVSCNISRYSKKMKLLVFNFFVNSMVNFWTFVWTVTLRKGNLWYKCLFLQLIKSRCIWCPFEVNVSERGSGRTVYFTFHKCR